MAAYYKVSLTDKDGSTGYMVFKTAEANAEEVLKSQHLHVPGYPFIVNSVELLWEDTEEDDVLYPFRRLMNDIHRCGEAGKALRDDLVDPEDITDQRMEAFVTILDTIKKKAQEAEVFIDCLFELKSKVTEQGPICVRDSWEKRL